MDWTREQIESLAPDPASLKAGQGLAVAGKWSAPAEAPGVIWGECQGSGAKPYRTQVALDAQPGFHCSCPSRKFPCKHALGLLLLRHEKPKAFDKTAPPAWVSEWIAGRAERVAKTEAPAAKKPRKEVSAETEAKRRANVEAGLQELRLWLEDLLRRGIAALPAESYRFFDQMAARLVDAQAPGAARWIRDLATIASSGGDWAEQILERLGLLHLLMESYRRLDELDGDLQAEIRTQLGWTQIQELLIEQPGQRDHWLILGQVHGVEDRLRIRRTWLLGRESGRYALLLDFAFGNQPYKQSWTPGDCIEAELVFFPASWPMRALIKPGWQASEADGRAPAHTDWQALRRWRAQALGRNPWLDLVPACLSGLTPHLQIDRFWLRDAKGFSLPIWQGFGQGWRLLALSGGSPLSLSLEFDGERVYPLGAWSEDPDEGRIYVPFTEAEAA